MASLRKTSALRLTTQTHIKGAISTMMTRSILIGADQKSENRCRKPMRDRLSQYACASKRPALTGNHHHMFKTARMGAQQKTIKQFIGFALCQTMQINACLNINPAFGYFFVGWPIKIIDWHFTRSGN